MNATRERVWAALNDAAVLQACIPGCESVTDESPTVRHAVVMIKMGPVRARFRGKVTLSEIEPPVRCVMAFEGSGGAAGMASGRSQVTLAEANGTTTLAYTVKASVGGKLGQIGGRMIDASAKQLADQFFGALRDHLAPPAPVPAASTAASDAAPDPVGSHDPAPRSVRTHAAPAASSGLATEAPRLLWFLMGVLATGLGVWLGARLF